MTLFDYDDAALIALILAVIAITLSVSVGISKTLAIQHHAAHYDAQTGAFTWNDEVAK